MKDRVLRRQDRPEPVLMLAVRGREPGTLIAVEASTPAQQAALLDPAERLPSDEPLAVLAPQRIPLPGGPWTWQPADRELPSALRSLHVVLVVGHYLPAGSLAVRWAGDLRADVVVVQHGLLTPYAPPLPHGATVLAFGDADLEFLRAGRNDLRGYVVGSQLLWNALQTSTARDTDAEAPPVYLGQLHGAEMGRSRKAASASEFLRDTGASYRPHPSENDILSRLQHERWRRRGITIDDGSIPLKDLDRPVVSIFSTGILEAAVRGLPAWSHYARPPAWLEAFWDRYGIHRWGDTPTLAPQTPSREPAQAIADHLLRSRR
ncbi:MULTISPECIES: RNA-binding protein [Arthrobacter]|uniref:RNA-binding protein n=2 Tax=Arthrobacter TaxID=1663 RepID=A0ABU9KLF0_9MICC|nr:RNA-binding protein [Arthrobacter sp. YJM1]MDP5227722.1 RNA-binding protein [Arthrobacter sp. YJM1]